MGAKPRNPVIPKVFPQHCLKLQASLNSTEVQMLAAATGAPIDERCQSRVVPARAGTRRSNDAVGRSVINHVDRWLWVPAFAGTTQRVGGPTTPTCPTGKSPVSCPAPSKKIFLLATDPTQTYIPRRPVPLGGGGSRRHKTRGGMRWKRRRAR